MTGPSLLESLTVSDGGAVNGKVLVNGRDIIPSAGVTYTGKIDVRPFEQ